MNDMDNIDLSYQATINKLENELSELRKDKQYLLDKLVEVSKRDAEHLAKAFELTKDQIRMDWLQSSDLTLRSWEEGDVWAKAGMYTIREFIDQAMEMEMRELK